MPRKLSSIAPDWWDYTTLDSEIIHDAAALTAEKMVKLSRPGYKVVMYDTLEEFYLAEALEYITAWKASTVDNPVGFCGPIGPTEQLPLVARLVNDLNLKVQSGHFWGMDEWFLDGKEMPPTHPLSFEKADREMCFGRIRKELVMPNANLHFPKADTAAYRKTWDAGVRCAARHRVSVANWRECRFRGRHRRGKSHHLWKCLHGCCRHCLRFAFLRLRRAHLNRRKLALADWPDRRPRQER